MTNLSTRMARCSTCNSDDTIGLVCNLRKECLCLNIDSMKTNRKNPLTSSDNTTPRLPKTLRRKGFTIVELLIVIVVIGILAAITIVAYTGIQGRAQMSAKSVAINNINLRLSRAVFSLRCFFLVLAQPKRIFPVISFPLRFLFHKMTDNVHRDFYSIP